MVLNESVCDSTRYMSVHGSEGFVLGSFDSTIPTTPKTVETLCLVKISVPKTYYAVAYPLHFEVQYGKYLCVEIRASNNSEYPPKYPTYVVVWTSTYFFNKNFDMRMYGSPQEPYVIFPSDNRNVFLRIKTRKFDGCIKNYFKIYFYASVINERDSFETSTIRSGGQQIIHKISSPGFLKKLLYPPLSDIKFRVSLLSNMKLLLSFRYFDIQPFVSHYFLGKLLKRCIDYLDLHYVRPISGKKIFIWKKCGVENIPLDVFNHSLEIHFVSDYKGPFSGFQAFYSFHEAIYSSKAHSLWTNCSDAIKPHVECNLHAECEGGADEHADCPYHGDSQQGGRCEPGQVKMQVCSLHSSLIIFIDLKS